VQYRIKIRMGDKELEVEGDKDFVEKSIDNLYEKIYGKVAPEVPSKVISLPSERPSFNEYLSEIAKVFGKDPDKLTGYQKILLIAYYVFKYENRDFTYDDIEKYSGEARLSGLANPRQYMSDLIRKGYLQESETEGKKKSFKILRRGIQYVEGGFKEEYEQVEKIQ